LGGLAQQDADHVRPITKGQIIEFFNEFISNKSPSRAKLAVHLYARGSIQSQQALEDLLERLDGETEETKDVVRVALLEPVVRSDTKALRGCLEGLKLSKDKIAAIMTATEDPATALKGSEDASKNASAPFKALPEPVYIRDVRSYKASLQASCGARPAKDVTEFEEIDAKL
jgi:insulysin